MSKKLYKIKVLGKVQGVYFRQSTKIQALQIGVSGWVKNLDDGSVFIHAEGNESQLNELVDWCKRGSATAKVDKVEIVEISPASGFETFYIEK